MRNVFSARFGIAALALGGALMLSSSALAAGVGDSGVAGARSFAAPPAADAHTMRAFVGVGRPGAAHGPRGAWSIGPHGFGPGFGPDFGVIAKSLNLTTQQLRRQLQSGKSVAQVAQAQNVALQTVEDAIVAAAKTRLDQAVAAGRLTSAQETARLTALRSGLATRLNATGGQFPRGLGHGRRPAGAATPPPTPATAAPVSGS